tara:strand:- start:7524 stop:7949 length:426 start_codon:yes stop_codon:yes gene_type:complete
MPTTYGADAQITGSFEVDGDIILGTGDDEVILKGLTYSIETKTGPGDDSTNLSAILPISLLSSTSGALSVTLPDGNINGQSKRLLVTGYFSTLAVTVTSASWAGGSGGTITFTAPATFIHLVWANSAWWIIGSAAAGISYS